MEGGVMDATESLSDLVMEARLQERAEIVRWLHALHNGDESTPWAVLWCANAIEHGEHLK